MNLLSKLHIEFTLVLWMSNYWLFEQAWLKSLRASASSMAWDRGHILSTWRLRVLGWKWSLPVEVCRSYRRIERLLPKGLLSCVITKEYRADGHISATILVGRAVASMTHSVSRAAWGSDLDLLGIRGTHIQGDLNDVLIVVVNVYWRHLLLLGRNLNVSGV